jgi:hypothetical protein
VKILAPPLAAGNRERLIGYPDYLRTKAIEHEAAGDRWTANVLLAYADRVERALGPDVPGPASDEEQAFANVPPRTEGGEA